MCSGRTVWLCPVFTSPGQWGTRLWGTGEGFALWRETVSSQRAPGERGAHPSPGWDGERDPRLQGRQWWGRANSCWCCFLVSGGRKLVPVDPGWDLVTCKLGLKMKSCWRGPGVSLGPQLSCCYWKLLESSLEALSPLAGTATLPLNPGSQGTKGLCQHVRDGDPCPDPPSTPDSQHLHPVPGTHIDTNGLTNQISPLTLETALQLNLHLSACTTPPYACRVFARPWPALSQAAVPQAAPWKTALLIVPLNSFYKSQCRNVQTFTGHCTGSFCHILVLLLYTYSTACGKPLHRQGNLHPPHREPQNGAVAPGLPSCTGSFRSL